MRKRLPNYPIALPLGLGEQMNPEAIPMLLHCPMCNKRHIDEGDFATKSHHTHACQHCGHVWRPAIVPTVGVQFLPGFKNEKAPPLARAVFVLGSSVRSGRQSGIPANPQDPTPV